MLIPWKIFHTVCHHKRGTCSTLDVFTHKHFHPYSQFSNVNSPFLFWKKMIDSSSHGCSFLSWTFHIWYKVLNNTCYIFSPLFLFHCFNQVATNFTYTSEISLILPLLKCLRSNAKKNHLCKVWNTNQKKYFLTVYKMFNWDATFYSVSQFLNNFPDLPRFPSLVFSIDRSNIAALFVDKNQVILNI